MFFQQILPHIASLPIGTHVSFVGLTTHDHRSSAVDIRVDLPFERATKPFFTIEEESVECTYSGIPWNGPTVGLFGYHSDFPCFLEKDLCFLPYPPSQQLIGAKLADFVSKLSLSDILRALERKYMFAMTNPTYECEQGTICNMLRNRK